MTDVGAVAGAVKAGLETAHSAGRFFDQLFGQGLRDAVGLAWSDRMNARRLEARIGSFERLAILGAQTRARLDSLGIEARQLPEAKVLLPLLEAATLEEDADLQQLWANLLATAVTDEAEPLQREFVSILTDLSPVGALALRDYYVAWQTLDRKPYRADGRRYGPGMDGDNYGIDTARGLVRLGLLEPSWIEFDNYRPGGEDDRYGDYPESLDPIRLAGDLSSVAMTQYGERFCRAVGMAGDPTRLRTGPDLRRYPGDWQG